MKKVIIHSDGGCHGNPGPGGWAAVLSYNGQTREVSGGVPATTNNRMELQAAIEALNTLKEPCVVDFYTDSAYVKDGISSWMKNWKRNGWKTQEKKPVKNVDLWQLLDAAVSRHQIQWHWVKGHSGQKGNERCDLLANVEIARIKEAFSREQLKAALEQFLTKDVADPMLPI